MLVIAVPDLVAVAAAEIGHEHAVVVDQPQLVTGDQDVAVLQVTVRDMLCLQVTNQLGPSFREPGNGIRPAQVARHVLIERLAFDPFHLQNGIPGSLDLDALGLEVEIDHVGDRAVACFLVGMQARETLHAPLLAVDKDAVGLAKRAAARPGHAGNTASRRVGFDAPRAQFWIGKAVTRVLNDLVVLIRLRGNGQFAGHFDSAMGRRKTENKGCTGCCGHRYACIFRLDLESIQKPSFRRGRHRLLGSFRIGSWRDGACDGPLRGR